jgi:uncharacterized Tic20 family protein
VEHVVLRERAGGFHHSVWTLVMLIGLAGLVFAVIAGLKANNGEDYKYPFSFQLIK